MLSKFINSIWGEIDGSFFFAALFLTSVICFHPPAALAQKGYFQQQLTYDIKVALDDREHFLNGTISINYKNNSPDTLKFIWMHLWPNAYADRNTALCKQLLEGGNTSLYFSKSEERGFIDSIEYKVNDIPATFISHPVYKDMGQLKLPEPMLPGESIEIFTPFRVKIPVAKFSRLGHIGESYQITQWYPKPAVYDREGWHQMPYLDQGEFYSEFGSFRVAITLPENYVVAATGQLEEAGEKAWLLNRAKITAGLSDFDTSLTFPPSSSNLKTITFIQDSIHDFAWFADKRFLILKSDFILPETGKPIECWAYFTNKESKLWKKSLEYIENGIRYYSQRVGAYPYSSYSAVDGTITAGGGMEYPMVTVIGGSGNAYTLENTIVHELGHSWFYGILGSNERDHGWMDEGMNTGLEMGYLESRYPGESGEGKNDLGGGTMLGSMIGINTMTRRDGVKQGYKFSSVNNSDQPIETLSSDFTHINYGTVMYGKTGLAFGFLEEYLGTQAFESAMHAYYDKWKFKHPQPNDLKQIFESTTNKNLDWFFNGMIKTNQPVKYKITKTVASDRSLLLNIENKGVIAAPVKLQEAGKPAQWIEGFTGNQSMVLKDYEGGDVKIYDGHVELLKRNRSIVRDRTILPSAPDFRLSMLPKLNKDPNVETLVLLPMVAWNRYNQGMAGLVFSNFSFIPKHFEYSITPLYDFKNNDIAGMGSLSYHIWPLNGALSEINVGMQGKRFAYSINTYTVDGIEIVDAVKPIFNYSRLAPAVIVKFRKKYPSATFQQNLSYRNISLWLDEEYSDNIIKHKNITSYLNYNELTYGFSDIRTLDPYSGSIKMEQSNNHNKISGEFKFRFSYAKFNKGVDLRVFAGCFLHQSEDNYRNYNFKMSGWEGSNDYLYDELYFGRTDEDKLWKQQFLVRDAGFKAPTAYGQSDKWIAAFNLDVDLPVPIPVSLFAGLGAFPEIVNDENKGVKFLHEAGIAIKPIRDILEIYVPLFYSNEIDTYLETNSIDFWKQIRFVFNINKITPYAIRNRLIEKY